MNFKKYISFLVFSLLCGLSSYAQIFLERQVIGATGGTSPTPWGSVDYTIGESVVLTMKASGGNIVLTQGFQQPDTTVALDSIIINIINSP